MTGRRPSATLSKAMMEMLNLKATVTLRRDLRLLAPNAYLLIFAICFSMRVLHMPMFF